MVDLTIKISKHERNTRDKKRGNVPFCAATNNTNGRLDDKLYR